MVEFLLGLSAMFNVAFIFIWVIGVKISKAQQKELQDQFEQDFGRQLTKYFENWIHVGGLDNMLLTPNGRLHRYLTKQAFINLLHPFQPFIIGQRIIGPAMAYKHDVKLVMYGENQAEYGNKVDDARNYLTLFFYSGIYETQYSNPGQSQWKQ